MARNLAAALLVGVGCFLAEPMHAAVHVSVLLEINAALRLDHLRGLLGGGGVVEVDQRFPTHLPGEDREIPAIACGIEALPCVSHDCLPLCHRVRPRPLPARTRWAGA